MGRKSREKREWRAQRTTARRALRHISPEADASQHVAYCAACGGITMGMQASGLYEGLVPFQRTEWDIAERRKCGKQGESELVVVLV